MASVKNFLGKYNSLLKEKCMVCKNYIQDHPQCSECDYIACEMFSPNNQNSHFSTECVICCVNIYDVFYDIKYDPNENISIITFTRTIPGYTEINKMRVFCKLPNKKNVKGEELMEILKKCNCRRIKFYINGN